jgi:hypothetical protein
MLFSKSCRFVLFFASLLSANAETVRGVQKERELTELKVELGTAGSYTILTKSGISTVPDSAITGDIAVSPIAAAAMTGFSLILDSEGTFSTSTQVTAGKAYAPDYAGNTSTLLTTAISDMETAYTDAAGRLNPDAARINLGAGEIGSLTLTPGVYTFGSSVNINDAVYIDASSFAEQDKDDAIFIIQMTGDLMLAANQQVILQGGALAKNIFWQVAGNVEVGADATMEGIILAKTAVTFITGSALNGRVLAQTACDLQQATITGPSI